MEFLGRVRELDVLEREHARSGFVVMLGRRRIGKTRLIKQFITGKKALYFLASKESEVLNRRRFAQSVGRFIGMPAFGEGSFSDWRPLFQTFADHAPSEGKILVIDELPYLIEGNAAFPSILQYAWDEILQSANVTLVLCGSSIHMMEEGVLESASPLYGRSSAQIRLKPLSFDEVSDGFPNYSFEDKMRLYAVTGGVPKYMEFFDGRTVEEAIRDNIFSTSGFLYNEPRFLLAQDTRNPLTHYSVLKAIAYGNHRVSDIAATLERPRTDILPYLKILERLGYVIRRTPATEGAPDKSKKGLYYICDGLLSFWFTFVLPYEGELEMGNMQPSMRAMASLFDSRFVALAFEDVSRQTVAHLCSSGIIPFEPNRIDSYWNKKSTIEIDVCATSPDENRILLGECKYHRERPFTVREYQSLVQKTAESGIASGKEALFCLFSKTGFEADLLDTPERGNTLFLINENELLP